MEGTRVIAVTSVSEQAVQLEHPSPEIIWARALEVFGNEEKAARWMRTTLPILSGCTPEQYSLSQDKAKQREVLTILGQIEFGIYS
jgi:uncharacterized protein (DUF2384 family)